MITYAQACCDPHLFGPWFEGPSWANWRVIDKALFGEPLNAEEVAIFRELTGRDEPPTLPASEAWFCIGRRGGKDVKAASLAAYLAAIGAEKYGWRKRLKRGETGYVLLLAVDRDQAAICLGYAKAFFEQPLLKKLVKRDTADSIELKNGLTIEVATNDQRRVRGRTVVASIFDEVAHWRSEDSTNPDEAIYQAVKPSMATMMPEAVLVGISSPHGRNGLFARKVQANYGKDGPVLVVKAPTWVMNPTLKRGAGVIAEAFEADPAWASAEYGAEFRTDVETFVSREIIDACTDNVREWQPRRQHSYLAFVDPSGGSSDSMTMAIAHVEAGTVVLDLVREARPPFAPSAVVTDFAKDLHRYQVWTVHGDRYGGEWPREQFRAHGIAYEPSEKSKSELYLAFLPLLNSHAARLIDYPRLQHQLISLERKATRGGRDTIDHPRGAHDDIANAVAGALVMAHAQGAITPARLMPAQADNGNYLPGGIEPPAYQADPHALGPGEYFSGPGWAPVLHQPAQDQRFAIED